MMDTVEEWGKKRRTQPQQHSEPPDETELLKRLTRLKLLVKLPSLNGYTIRQKEHWAIVWLNRGAERQP